MDPGIGEVEERPRLPGAKGSFAQSGDDHGTAEPQAAGLLDVAGELAQDGVGAPELGVGDQLLVTAARAAGGDSGDSTGCDEEGDRKGDARALEAPLTRPLAHPLAWCRDRRG